MCLPSSAYTVTTSHFTEMSVGKWFENDCLPNVFVSFVDTATATAQLVPPKPQPASSTQLIDGTKGFLEDSEAIVVLLGVLLTRCS
jgi:hypothetical protein